MFCYVFNYFQQTNAHLYRDCKALWSVETKLQASNTDMKKKHMKHSGTTVKITKYP